MSEVFVTCPHCSGVVGVLDGQVNCAIFRHGVIIRTGQQMDPHANKETCDRMAREGLIYGCGKPFQLVDAEGRSAQNRCASVVSRAIVCDYV